MMDPESDRVSSPDLDLLELHSAVLREPPDPVEGGERGPWWLWAGVFLAVFAGGFYLGRFGGAFFSNVYHIGYVRPSAVSDVPGPGEPQAPSASAATPVADGAKVYAAVCVTCHQANGQGLPPTFPPLVDSPWVLGPPHRLILLVLHGLQGPLTVKGVDYNGVMPAWQTALSDADIAAVTTHVRRSWGHSAPEVARDQVRDLRARYSGRSQPWTGPELEAAREEAL